MHLYVYGTQRRRKCSIGTMTQFTCNTIIQNRRQHIKPLPPAVAILLELFLILIVLLQFSNASTTTVLISEPQLRTMHHNGTSWIVTMATFGDPMERNTTTEFDLMYPPIDDLDGTLCTFKMSGLNTVNNNNNNNNSSSSSNYTIPHFYTYPIGIFVSADGCTPEIKALNLLHIQAMEPRVTYLVVYGTDQESEQVVMGWDYTTTNNNNNITEMTNENPVERMAALYIPTRDAKKIQHRLELQQIESNRSAHLFDPRSEGFSFRVQVRLNELTQDNDDNNKNDPEKDSQPTILTGQGAGEEYDTSFYWFRFVLFALLIVAPCFRAAWLWYQGGGRVIWRRNEMGRIIGLQYIPPIPYWLAAGRFLQPNHPPTNFTLTEEQFANLPEIKYEAPDSTDAGEVMESHISDNPEAEDIVNRNTPNVIEDSEGSPVLSEKDLEKQLSSLSTSPSNGTACDQTDVVVVSVDTSESEQMGPQLLPVLPNAQSNPSQDTCSEVVHESALTHQVPVEDLTRTTCTSCSICIEDFEVGETLILLPLCRHAFHRSCIQPWLMERQGCCPLCKTAVLSSSNDPEIDDSIHRTDAEEVSAQPDEAR